jgi:hypothetical protein
MASANKAGDTCYGAVYFVVWGPVAETTTFLRVPVLIVAKTPRGVVAGVHKVRCNSWSPGCVGLGVSFVRRGWQPCRQRSVSLK